MARFVAPGHLMIKDENLDLHSKSKPFMLCCL